MCGIGGKVSFDSRPEPDIPAAMNACMDHRGPDAKDVYANGPCVLAHRRLSILDLSEAGRQPMPNADGTVHIAFNGEIYNYRELRNRVDDYLFESETDTEVLLHLYEEYGVDCLQYLRGMFAFAIWDENAERLFFARDRLGQKPLFYNNIDSSFTFGSTIPAVLADPAVTSEPDLRAIRSYLTHQYVPSPRTGFAEIAQLPPAHSGTFDRDGLSIERYWEVSYANQFDDTPGRLADRLYEQLREATRLRMRSDVPLGVFLSGGVDSSAVAALISDLSEEPIQTYSIGFDVEEYDELDFARLVAERYETEHTEYTLSADSMLDSLDTILDHYGMPFGDTSTLPTYHVSRLASRDITVALSGDAGDENFAGYDRYRYDQIVETLSKVPRPIRSATSALLNRVPEPLRQHAAIRKPRLALKYTAPGQPDSHAQFVCHATSEQARALWAGPEPADEIAEIRRVYENSDGPTQLDRILNVDLQTYLPDDILVKVDRASMAHSLEVRSPFLDHQVVEFAARVPIKPKLRKGEGKWLLKRAFQDSLPDDVLYRPKQGFGVPVNEWLRGTLADLTDRSLRRLGERDPFRAKGLESVWEDHRSGRRDNGFYLWDLLMLEQWYERYIDAE